MFNCGGLLKTVLVALVMVAAVRSADEKLASCCKRVTSNEITDPITGYMVQKASSTCVRAVIFQTEKGLFCSQVRAPWVRRKIIAFERAKARATPSLVSPSSTVSLLSIITSTASPPPPPSSSSSSSSPASLASTSEAPAERGVE